MSIFSEVLNKDQALSRLASQFVEPSQLQAILKKGSTDELQSLRDFFEKGKKAQIGEVREWSGIKMMKTERGWVPAQQSARTARKEADQKTPFTWKGSLQGPEEFGSPEFEQDLDTNYSTQTQYQEKGQWSEKRMQKVHQPIVKSYVARGQKNPDGVKTVTLMMGAPASGKSRLRSSLTREGVIDSHLVVIVPDDIKTKALAPDFDRYSEVNARHSAEFVHEEGSDIAKEAFAAMEEQGFDYLQDKVFADYGKLIKEINRLGKAGYKVKIVMASCPVDVAYKRMQARGKATGRYVVPDYFRQTHKQIEETWTKLMENMPSNVLSARKYNTATQSNWPEMVDSFEANSNQN